MAISGPIDVILPAGGELDSHFARVALTNRKSLIKLDGGQVLTKILFALNESGRIGQRVLVGPDEVHQAAGEGVQFKVRDTGDLLKNVNFGIGTLLEQPNPPTHVLILPTDLPYLDGKIINAFLDLCDPSLDLNIPVITKQQFLDRFPSASATFAKLKDDDYTLGCAFVVNAQAFKRIVPKIQLLVENRKNVLKMAKTLGFGFLWNMAFKKLSLDDIERKALEICGCTGKVVLGAPAELSFDIDEIDDYEYALRNK